MQADDELLSLWDDQVLTPALRWGISSGKKDVVRWVDALQKVFTENREMLTNLDSATHMATHMDRGFTAAQAELSAHPQRIPHSPLRACRQC